MAELSEYELEREKRIAANKQKLAELGLNGPEKKLRRPGLGGSRKKKRKVVVDGEAVAPRRSSRLKQEKAPDVYVMEEGENGAVSVGGADAASSRARLSDPDVLPIDADDLTSVERDVYEVLRAARNAKARAMQRSMFIVCNDRSMAEMVRTVPSTLADLGELYGMGPKKVADHGALLLDALKPHVPMLVEHHDATRRARDSKHHPGSDREPGATEVAAATT